MNPPLHPSRSSFDKTSLQEVINRYGWSKDIPAKGGQGEKASKPAAPAPVSKTDAPRMEAPKPVEPVADLPVFQAPPPPIVEADPRLKQELEEAKKKILELTAELEEKDGQITIISQQCEELKERGDDFEKSAFKENSELLKLKGQLETKEALVSEHEKKITLLQQEITAGSEMFTGTVKEQFDLEEKLKTEHDNHQSELAELKTQVDQLTGQLTGEGGVSVHDSLAKYKQQAKQGAELLKQSLAESRRLESEVKVLQARLEEEKSQFDEQLAKQQEIPAVPPELIEQLRLLEEQNLELQKRAQDAEAQATNSQAAVSHAMDFAYQATQDNELMKKKLAEAGIRM